MGTGNIFFLGGGGGVSGATLHWTSCAASHPWESNNNLSCFMLQKPVKLQPCGCPVACVKPGKLQPCGCPVACVKLG